MSTLTMGELFAQRKFQQDMFGGVPRFVPGQYGAKKFTTTDAILSYVDREGCVCIIPVDKIGNEWFHKRVLLHVSMTHAAVRQLPKGFGLTDEMMRALQAKKKPASNSQTA